MTTDVGALRLSVRYDEGAGPVIVLLHGINSDAASWRTVVDTIGPGYRVIAPDLLGFGQSPKPDDLDYTADQHAEVLAATLADLGVSERFVLVGYSMGGNVAVRYAARNPDRLRRLMLLSAPFYLPPEAYSRDSFGWQYAQARFFQWLWRVVGWQKEKDTLVYGIASGPLQAQIRDFMKTDDLAQHWDVMQKNLVNTVSAATFVDDLPRLTMPAIFALGIRDPIVRPDQTMALKRILPSLEVRRIVGLSADHMLLIKAPSQVAHEILADEVKGLHVRTHRGAGDPVVLLPGLGEDGRVWDAVAEALVATHDVVALDLLGFGESPRPLSSHYTLEDHASAVHATVAHLFGTAPVTLVGRGFGATVALACAASDPDAVRSVVAFSPILVDPRVDSDQRANPTVAAVLAARDSYATLARDERAQRRASERLEAEVVPMLRSIDTILATDAGALLAGQERPVRLVLPRQDTVTPRTWLTAEAAARPGLEVVEVDGDTQAAYRQPELVAALVRGEPVPGDSVRGEPVPGDSMRLGTSATPGSGTMATAVAASGGTGGDLARRLLGGANAQLLRHGVLALLGGLLLLLLPVQIPVRVVAWGFAVWLLVEAVQTIAGAVGLKQHGNAWLGWLLIGVVSLLFAGLVAVGDTLARGVLVWAIAGWALGRAAATLFSAWRAPSLPGRRAGLVLEGVLALVVGISILVVPEFGGRLLRWVLGAYLTASGAASLAIAYSTHRATVRRVKESVTRARAGS